MKSLFPFLALLLAAGCARHESATAPVLPPVSVRLAPVVAEDRPQVTEVTGTIRPVQRAALAPRIMGAIIELPVALGQPVRAGEVLARLFADEAKARVTQARAQFNVVSRDLERERDLFTKGASTAEMVRNLQDRYAGAEAALHEAEAQLGYTEIRAPFDGVVTRKLAQAGDLANPGQPILEVEETAHFEIESSVPDSLAAGLAVGARLGCDADGSPFTAAIREISAAADPATRSVGVKLDVPAGARVRSGQFVRVQVPGARVPTILVPATAVSVNGQMERVFVASDDRHAVLRLVKTGDTRDGQTEILAGLAAGDRVVVSPPAGLRDGQPLEVQP